MSVRTPTTGEAEKAREVIAAYERGAVTVAAPSWQQQATPWAFGAIAVVALVVLIIYGDPEQAREWVPVLGQYGTLVTAGAGAYLAWQSRAQRKLSEEIKVDVNSGNTAALEVKGAEAYARGVFDTAAEVKTAVAAALAEERAKTVTEEATKDAVTKLVQDTASRVPASDEPTKVIISGSETDEPVPVTVEEEQLKDALDEALHEPPKGTTP